MSLGQKGVALIISASVLFAGFYYLAPLLFPLSGTEIFGWRMLLTLPFITLLMLGCREWYQVEDIVARAFRHPLLILGLLLSSALLGVQQWLFLWAPVAGSALEVSLGYFLLPLTMLLVGRVLYRDQLRPLQIVAAASAMVGVFHELFRQGTFSWETLLVALGFPAYFVLRKVLRTNNLGGLWFDIALMSPVCLYIALSGDVASYLSRAPSLSILVTLLAAMSAVAFMAYTSASKMMPLALFGLMGYIEPVLLFIVSLAIGESVGSEEILTYGPVIAAVVILAADGFIGLMRPKVAPGVAI
ncbi:EamA family transporter RarD (plasmid) [Rhizobium leguminosarum]